MISNKKNRHVQAGLLGLSHDFDHTHRQAMARLTQRLKVNWVYDAVPLRAQQLATDMRISAMHSLHQMLSQPDLDAVLILNRHWFDSLPLELCLERQKSLLYLAPFPNDISLEKLRAWHHLSGNLGMSVILGLTRRYTPSTIRLQELLASRLGYLREIRIKLPAPQIPSSGDGVFRQEGSGEISTPLIQAIDWCRHLIKRKLVPLSVIPSVHRLGCGSEPAHMVLRAPAWDTIPEVLISIDQSGTELTSQETSIASSPKSTTSKATSSKSVVDNTPALDPTQWKIEVFCDYGSAEIGSLRRISWKFGTEHCMEELLAERSALELLLDLFCRRLLSALVPLPDLGDLIRAREVLAHPAP